MRITLFGNWVDYGDFSWQQFMVVDHRYGRWITVQTGYNCIGKSSIVVEYCLNPNAEPFETFASVTRANYSKLDGYLADCSLREKDIFEDVPCPSWAVYCQLV